MVRDDEMNESESSQTVRCEGADLENNEWMLRRAIIVHLQRGGDKIRQQLWKEHMINHTIAAVEADTLHQESSARATYLS